MNRQSRRAGRNSGKTASSSASGRAHEAQPDYVDALCNLARAHLARGDIEQALQTIWQALAQRETPDAKAIFIGCFSRFRFAGDAPELRGVVARAMSETWSNINDFSTAACDLAKRSPPIASCLDRVAKAWPTRLTGHDLWSAAQQSSICGDPLLLALLQSAPVADLDFERFLTSARSTLLQNALAPAATEPIKPSILEFYCALARQCFINEYIYAATEEELRLARQLQQSLLAALNSQADVPLLWPVAVAAYFPLHSSSAQRHCWIDRGRRRFPIC
jgi:hypothetical protein